MADYKSKVHNVYFSASIMPTEKLRMFGTVNFNKAESALDQVIMPDVQDRLYNDNIGGVGVGGYDLTHQHFTFDEMDQYSDLNYQLLQFWLGAEYALTSMVKLTVDGSYADLTDDAPYVYGDESGSIFDVRAGVKVDF